MKFSVKISLPLVKKGYPPERTYYASDLNNLVKIGSSLYGEKPYFRFRRAQKELSLSYRDFDRLITCVGTAFSALHLRGEAIAVIGETTPEWVITYLAAVNGGSVIVPLDKELAPEQIANFIRRANVRYVIHSHLFTERFRMLAEELPDVRGFAEISRETFPSADDAGMDVFPAERFTSFDSLVRFGIAELKKGNHAFENHIIDPEAHCASLFTSGTTGTSKIVMLSQKNITTVINGAWRMIDVRNEDVLVSVLPLHHTYEFTCGILTPIFAGATVCINESLKTVLRSFKQYQPTILVLVPLFVTTIHKKIVETVHRKGMDEKLKIAMTASNAARYVGIDLRRTLFSEVLDTFGGRLDRIVCGGAAMNPALSAFFDSIGIKLTQGYGITECSPLISVSPFNWIRGASVGLPMPGLEVKIGENALEQTTGTVDEIIVRGDNVMLGYQDDADATGAVLDEDGWFHTGDIGYMDKQGFLYITGRKKNVIVLHNGKNVFPEEIEEYLEPFELISECVVVGRTAADGETINVTALVYPNFEKAEQMGLHGIDAISEQLRTEINKLNTNLPSFKQIRGVEIRKTPFIKTTTQKIIRYRVDEEAAQE